MCIWWRSRCTIALPIAQCIISSPILANFQFFPLPTMQRRGFFLSNSIQIAQQSGSKHYHSFWQIFQTQKQRSGRKREKKSENMFASHFKPNQPVYKSCRWEKNTERENNNHLLHLIATNKQQTNKNNELNQFATFNDDENKNTTKMSEKRTSLSKQHAMISS